ncbi:MAG: tetratricopeptide repeat protein [Woeseiaceae bacterium]
MLTKFFRELRRREVFRTAGLYVGIGWLLVEVSSVVLPAFEAPDWILRALIILLVVGFPVTLVLAWIYDFTDQGIVVQGDHTDTIVPPIGSRKMDFVVIGVLSVALIVSVYLNITSGPEVVEEMQPISVLIADFDNTTGDPVFDGSIEQALQIGLEGASFITSFPRLMAGRIARTMQPESTGLNAELAQLVAVREGIDVMLNGEIRSEGDGFKLVIRGVDGAAGEELLSASAKADGKLEVLTAVSSLTGEVRESLGDTDVDGLVMETFTAASIEAMRDYTQAQQLAQAGKREEAIERYASAVDKDPNFGRALSGWALTLFNMGRADEANALWERALSKMDTMTPRERYRTLGLYYMAVTGNYEKAIENYSALVDAYPADNSAHSNLAVAYFMTLDFDSTRDHGRQALEVYPNNLIMQSNYALFAMYAGDFETAIAEAEKTLALDDNRYVARLPIAMAKASTEDFDGARAAYEQMAAAGERGQSLGNLGIADLEMLRGDFTAAVESLTAGIAHDDGISNARSAATKRAMLAEALAVTGDSKQAKVALQPLLQDTGAGRAVPAALVSLQIGDTATAASIAEALGAKLQSQSRAYSLMIEGMLKLRDGEAVAAIDKLRAAIDMADLWLVRFQLGKAYLEADFSAEAMDEFQICYDRVGDATSLFLDDRPTWRYTATLPYWFGRAEEALGMDQAAKDKYDAFLRVRSSGPLAEDARGRL